VFCPTSDVLIRIIEVAHAMADGDFWTKCMSTIAPRLRRSTEVVSSDGGRLTEWGVPSRVEGDYGSLASD
jgi:hypothetical protein